MRTILIIEDDHQTRVELRQNLEADGFFVFTAANGIDGLAMLKRIQAPSVILLDWMMPLMNGEEFLALKARDRSLDSIPVVIMSAFPDKWAAAMARGFKDYTFLKKPFRMTELLGAIERGMRGAEPKSACLIDDAKSG